jgi:hypothetical protein
MMHGLKLKYRHIGISASLSRDLATHIYENSSYGKVVVVASNPASMLSSVRKQYLRMIYRTRIERSRTLRAEQVRLLSNEIAHMQRLRFTAKLSDILAADVTFATAENMAHIAPECFALYVTYDFPKEKLYLMTSWMPKNGQVVIYE